MNQIKTKMIEENCLEKGIELFDISYDWITLLKKNGIEKKMVNGKFFLNPRISVELAKDKYSTYELLKYHGIPILEHQVLFNSELMPDVERINRNYECLNEKKQVLKSNTSSQGIDVFVSEKKEEKKMLVEDMFKREIEAVVVTDYEEIEFEYRVIVLEGEVVYVYKKQKPFVIGDGTSNLRELIERNLKYLVEPVSNLDLEKIPVKGEKVTVGWKHNLSNGAVPELITQEDGYVQEVERLALEVGKILGLRFASIDVSVTNENKVYVMEANSNVCLTKFCEILPNGYEIVKNIYRKVLERMFEGEKYENRD